MDQKQVKEILGEQMELLAEVSKKTGKPEELPELSEAMCEIADRLKEVYDPIIHHQAAYPRRRIKEVNTMPEVDEYRRQARETHSQLFDRIRDLERAESARNEQYKQIMEKLDQLLEWQNTQQSKPQAFVDDIKGKIIWAILAAVIAFILGRVGL